MVQWGALADTDLKGVYRQIPRRIAVPESLGCLLAESLLIHEGRGMPVEEVRRHPALFPFELNFTHGALRRSSVFQVDRQGLDEDVVRLVS